MPEAQGIEVLVIQCGTGKTLNTQLFTNGLLGTILRNSAKSVAPKIKDLIGLLREEGNMVDLESFTCAFADHVTGGMIKENYETRS